MKVALSISQWELVAKCLNKSIRTLKTDIEVMEMCEPVTLKTEAAIVSQGQLKQRLEIIIGVIETQVD